MFRYRNPLFALSLLFLFSLLWGGLWLESGLIPLDPDEAQYWLWSHYLDWGYYSKPPLIAWQIALGRSIFGETEWGVRSIALLLHALLPCATFLLAKEARLSSRTSLISALILATAPISLIAAFLATTDAGSVLFWTVGAAWTLRAFYRPKTPLWPLGLFILIGTLFKWTTFLLWIPAALLLYRSWRPLINAFFLSLLAFIPSLLWNMTHDWVTFRHVATQTASSSHPNPVDFFLGQIALLGPIAFTGMLLGSYKSWKNPLTLGFWGVFLSYLTLSFFQKMQINWMVFMLPFGATIAAISLEKIKGAIIAHCCFSIAACSLLLAGLLPWHPLIHTRNNDKLKEVFADLSYHPDSHFLCSDSYQTCSLLSFYTPGQQRAHFFNIGQKRYNQFCFWPSLQEDERESGFFVTLIEEPLQSQKYETRLKPYFKELSLVKVAPLHSKKWAAIFYCQHLKKMPEQPACY